MRMSEKCRNNNNSNNPLTSRRTDGGNNLGVDRIVKGIKQYLKKQNRLFLSFISSPYSSSERAKRRKQSDFKRRRLDPPGKLL